MFNKVKPTLVAGAVIGAAALVAVPLLDSPVKADPPACVGTHLFVTYPADGASLTCAVQAGQDVNIRWLPSTWTLSTAHSWCIAEGSPVGVRTLYGGNANVCLDVDHP